MDKMKEFYEKITGNSELKMRLDEIMKAAEKNGKEVTGKKLLAFANEAGIPVAMDEIMHFIENRSGVGQMELSQEALSEVAGGASSQPCDLKKNKIFS